MASKGKTPAQRAHRARIRIIHQALTGMDIEKQPYAERLKDKEFLPGLRAIVKKAWDDMIEAWLNTLHEVPAILEERIKTEFHKCYKVEGEIMIEEKLAEEMSTLAETARQELVGRIEPLLKECKE
ncbi:hypothetical protein HII31_06236 [Pseudocercospora fuligena]|nr:hypothetical protein HII31_06236 [Pseudocercospora fuligena]